jgi:RNA polymerase sigma-70 factor (sigma-E family)
MGAPDEDVLLSRLYQQLTEAAGPGFGAGYDLRAGLDRYRVWLRERTVDPSANGTGEWDADRAGMEWGADRAGAGEWGADRAGAGEWSADRAVTELYSVHYRSLVRLAAMLVRDIPTSEEVVQDAFVAMHGGWNRLKDPEKALAYLRQAVVNKSRSVLRHRAVVDKNLLKAPPDMPSAEHGAIVLLERSEVVAALRDLPERQREAIVLRYYADMSEAEIAAAMKISRGAVKSHTARGMAALRAALERE